MNQYKNRLTRRIYRSKDIESIQEKLNMLGSNRRMDAITFLNIRLVTSIIIFIFTLYKSDFSYIAAPVITVSYYYLFFVESNFCGFAYRCRKRNDVWGYDDLSS